MQRAETTSKRQNGRRTLLGVAAASLAAVTANHALRGRTADADDNTMVTGTLNPTDGAPEDAQTTLRGSVEGRTWLVSNEATSGTNRVAMVGVVGGSASTAPFDAAAVMGESFVNSPDSSGVYGNANGGIGVWGRSPNGVGIRAEGGSIGLDIAGVIDSGKTGIAIAGLQSGTGIDITISNDAATGLKVTSDALGLGVDANVPGGYGLKGTSASQTKAGVFGVNNGGPAMQGDTVTGQGVIGRVTGTGVGVCALDDGGNHGTALVVLGTSTFSSHAAFSSTVSAAKFIGKANGAPRFNTVGSATIGKGEDRVTVMNAAAKSASRIFVTLQTDPGNAAVKCVKRHAGSFDILLTANAGRAAKAAWFIIG
jgi:hypothetical protein